MNDEARLMMLIWESISDFISTSDKQTAAQALVSSFIESGHEIDELYDADGECPYIDKALASTKDVIDEDGEETGDEDY